MTTTKPSHNHNTDLPDPLSSQQAIHESDEAALRAAVEEVFGDLHEDVSHADLKTRCVMALLLVKYEDRQIGETKSQFINRRNDIMATAVKKKLAAELETKKVQRSVTPAKAVKPAPAAAAAPAKAPKAGKQAEASADAPAAGRGRTANVNKVKVNPEGGTSKLNTNSERAQVFELIKKAGAKGITIEDLDAAFAEVCEVNGVESKKTRGFVLKLLEKSHVIVLS